MSKMLSNLSGSANWGDQEDVYIEKPVVKKVEEIYEGPEFKFGDIVKVKGKEDFGTGVIFKALDKFNYWVAFPTKADEHLTSMPCFQNTYRRTELQLEEVQKN
jgi:hypothetical protein